ncbi:MAG TPA: hypothetical protein ACFYD6_13725 [Candidatus Brocadiia bacterium]|nr:hypothetical protein [Planctomycetota bacterium]MDO8094341.1 hypothetical protein [Candidatus Brocadiales bacterium]
MIDILLGILMLVVLIRVPGPPKVGLLILLGLLYWINRRRKKTKPQQHGVIKDEGRNIVTLSKDQYKVH